MARSHPPTLLKVTARTLAEECGSLIGARVLVAISGGADSAALLHVLSRLAPRFSLELRAHGIDHGLRVEAQAELALAENLAARCGVPFGSTRVALTPGGNLQERAREVRYAALQRAADDFGQAFIATAHHADDRAETVLLRLLRGAGVRGLGVLPARAGRLLRPFVRATKADILTHLGRHNVAYAEDASNRDARFLRARVRHEVLPLLAELSPRVVQHLNALADEALSGPQVSVTDAHGHLVPLGRAQADQLGRARRLGQRGARIPLGNGVEVRFDPGLGDFVVRPEGENSPVKSADSPNVRESGRLGSSAGSR